MEQNVVSSRWGEKLGLEAYKGSLPAKNWIFTKEKKKKKGTHRYVYIDKSPEI